MRRLKQDEFDDLQRCDNCGEITAAAFLTRISTGHGTYMELCPNCCRTLAKCA